MGKKGIVTATFSCPLCAKSMSHEQTFSSVSEVASVMLISVAVYVIGWATLRGFTVKFHLQTFVKGK